ncbi:hypothetical protein TSMEX_007118, partial [Taenia solium]
MYGLKGYQHGLEHMLVSSKRRIDPVVEADINIIIRVTLFSFALNFMESDLWSLLAEVLTRTVGQSVNSELGKVRSVIPENSVQLQNIIAKVDFILHRLEEKHRQKVIARILGDISVWVEHIWHYSASCLRVCCGGDDSNESVVTACRVALQESWYTDAGSPSFPSRSLLDSSKNNTSSRSVIYLSPAAPSHLRRWLSLNLCCSGLLITVLPAEDNSALPTIV